MQNGQLGVLDLAQIGSSRREYCISLNIGPGVYFLPVSFDPALKRGRCLNGAGIYNKINVRYSRILLGSTPNSLAAASFDFSQPSQRPLA